MIAASRIFIVLVLIALAPPALTSTTEATQLETELAFDNVATVADTGVQAPPPAASVNAAADFLAYRMLQQRNATTYAWILAVTAVVAHLSTLFFLRHIRGAGSYVVSVTGLIYVIFGTILLVVIASTEAQLTAAMGILGAVAGYVFGKSKRESTQPEPAMRNPPAVSS